MSKHFKTVPVYPTYLMIGAGARAVLAAWEKDRNLNSLDTVKVAYAAMLAAAPSVATNTGQNPVRDALNAILECDITGGGVIRAQKLARAASPAIDAAPERLPSAPTLEMITAYLTAQHDAAMSTDRAFGVSDPRENFKAGYRAMLATLSAQNRGEEAADSERLDFMLDNKAFTVRCNRDGSITQYQLMTQDEDENYHVLHDEHRFYNTERDAIDAALSQANKGNGNG